MKPSFPEKCGRIQAVVLAVLTLILIWLPALDSVFHLDTAPPTNENRAPAKFPEWQFSPEGLHKFIAGLELYYNDHFGFRNRLIRWQHKWSHELFKQAVRDDVISGRDGWLFFSTEHMIENLRGDDHFAPGQLQAWQSLLESRRDWCHRHGCAYIFVIPPDKHSVYPEYLPDWLVPGKGSTKLDEFVEFMKLHSTVPVLDLRPALLAAKGDRVLYLSTDTHWNSLGAFVGYQSLVEALAGQLPELKPLPLDAFDAQLKPRAAGDLARMLGQEQSMVEKENVALSPRPPLKPLTDITDTNLLAKTWIKNTEPKFTVNPGGKGKVIMFHDSFANSWVPFLGHNFNEVIYIWQYNWDMNFLKQQQPDVVIDEMLERFVISKDPAHLTENW